MLFAFGAALAGLSTGLSSVIAIACYFASEVTAADSVAACFFFQSPIAARIASSASTEQWIFTGGRASSFPMSVFLWVGGAAPALPCPPSGAGEEEAIAEPQPKVLNFASSITPVAWFTLICSFITSPHSGAPTKPVPTSLLLLSNEPTLRGFV